MCTYITNVFSLKASVPTLLKQIILKIFFREFSSKKSGENAAQKRTHSKKNVFKESFHLNIVSIIIKEKCSKGGNNKRCVYRG